MNAREHIIIAPTSPSQPYAFGFCSHGDISESVYDIHYELELGVVLSGTMQRYWNNTQRTLNRGDIWINTVWEPHGFSLTEVPCDVAVFLLRPEVFSTLQLGVGPAINWFHPFSLPPQSRPNIPERHREVILQSLRQPELANLSTAPLSDFQLTDSFLILLQLLRFLGTPTSAHGDIATSTIQHVFPALELVFKRRNVVQEKEGATACHMSQSTFRRKFKRVMGVSFGQFALHHRLKSAALELGGCRSIEDISERWGFTDVSHFHRAFKKVFRQTPAAYKRLTAQSGVMQITENASSDSRIGHSL